jgi:hypothetical protein
MIFNKSYFFKVLRTSLFLFLFIFIFFYFFTSKADAAPEFTIDAPDSATVGLDTSIDVDSIATSGDAIYGLIFNLNYDPDVLDYTDFSYSGPGALNVDAFLQTPLDNEYPSEPGRIRFVYTSGNPYVYTGTFLRLDFNVISGAGTSTNFTFTDTFANNLDEEINPTFTGDSMVLNSATGIQLTISDPTLTTTKDYDGTTTASVEAGNLGGVLLDDDVTVSAVATYDNANVGTGKTITVVYTLGGDDAGNYIKPVNYVVTTGVINAIPITVSAIAGVTPPVTGAAPDLTITETAQYTGTTTWSPPHNPYLESTVYTATITLVPKTGYTLTGIIEDFFTVAGSTSTTNEANSGVVTAVFPATTAATAPVLGSSSASSISKTSATLNGSITSTGGVAVTSRGFHYGLDTEYGQQVVANGSFGNGAYSLGVSGLTCATTYHYRSFATNSVGTTNGSDATFTTSNCSSGGGSSGSYLPSFNPFNPPYVPPTIPPTTPPATPPTTPPAVIPLSSITRNLKLDMIGEDVKALQVFLNNNGYVLATVGNGSPGNETDFFGEITKQAVIKFQTASGLTADGIVGPATINKMK